MQRVRYGIGAVLLTLVVATPHVALAAAFRSGDVVRISETVEDDVYAAGESITVTAPIGGDFLTGGQQITIEEEVAGDVFAAGNTLLMSGPVADDVLVAGQTIILSGTAEDVFAAGNTIRIEPSAEISGDVYVAGASVEIAGTIQGTVRASAGSVYIADGATIAGDLITYGQANQEPTVADGATISGNVEHVVNDATVERAPRNELADWVRGVVTWFVAAAALLYLLPRFSREVVTTATTRGGAAFGIGVLWILLLVPAFILLLVTVVGIPLAFLGLLGSGLALLAAIPYATLLLGAVVMRRLSTDTAPVQWQHALLGAVLYKTIPLIPFVGWLILLGVFLWSLGSLGVTMWHRLRGEATPAQTAHA